MRFEQFFRHNGIVVEIGETRIRVQCARVENSLRRALDPKGLLNNTKLVGI